MCSRVQNKKSSESTVQLKQQKKRKKNKKLILGFQTKLGFRKEAISLFLSFFLSFVVWLRFTSQRESIRCVVDGERQIRTERERTLFAATLSS